MRLAAHAKVMFGLALLATMSVARPSLAVHRPPGDAELSVKESLSGGTHAFCTHPPRLLGDDDMALCPLAKETPGCEALAQACDKQKPEAQPHNEPSSMPKIPPVLGKIAMVGTIVIVVAVLLALLLPILLAFLKSRRDAALADITPEEKTAPGAAVTPEVRGPVITDAERLLALANDLAARGQLKEALGTYLTASLRALDHKGLIRFARHRTNGEYVRSCTDAGARSELSAVVREVESSEFGGHEPSHETVTKVARSAASLVRAGMLGVMLVLLAAGCGGGPNLKTENDPAGKQLLVDVLKKQGLEVSYLPGSIGSMPIPGDDATTNLVILDLSVTKLDDEARTHLLAWVRAGGVLLALEPRADMEDTLAVDTTPSTERDVTVLLHPAYDDDPDAFPARLARGRSLKRRHDAKSRKHGTDEATSTGPDEATLWEIAATMGPPEKADDATDAYAIEEPLGKGAIVTVATADLFTNVGILHKDNASAVMTLIERAFHSTRRNGRRTYFEHPVVIARPQSGMTPPGNPLSAISAAGLGMGMWHALAAAAILFLAVGLRQARPRPAPPPTRRAFAEHVEATGALYAKAKAASHARSVLAKYTDDRVRAKAQQRLQQSANDDPFKEVTGKTAAEYKELVSPATAPEMTELHKMRELRRVLAKLSPKPQHHQEKKDNS